VPAASQLPAGCLPSGAHRLESLLGSGLFVAQPGALNVANGSCNGNAPRVL
jgi:hypothetical protein